MTKSRIVVTDTNGLTHYGLWQENVTASYVSELMESCNMHEFKNLTHLRIDNQDGYTYFNPNHIVSLKIQESEDSK